MIALDTNLVVRFLVNDDPDQARISRELIGGLSDSDRGFVSREVLLELVWVLESAYGYSRAEICNALIGILSATEIMIECSHDVGMALVPNCEGHGFADLMIASAARRSGATELATFDRKAASLPGARLLGA